MKTKFVINRKNKFYCNILKLFRLMTNISFHYILCPRSEGRGMEEKMKVVQINTVENGCTGRIAYSLKKILESKGHECIIAYGRGKFSIGGTYRISNLLDSSIHGVMTRIFDTTGLHSKKVTYNFLKMLDEFQPDIVHIHNLHGYYINYKLLFDYLKKNKIRTFWTLHDCWPFTGHCPYYTYVGCHKWKTGCNNCQQKKHHPTSYIFDRSIKNYNDKKQTFLNMESLTIITPSNWLKDEVKKSFLKEYDVVHIPNGIDLNKFKPTKNIFRYKNNLMNKIVILGVANLWAITKGMNYFFQLHEILPREKFQIVLVGLSKKQKKKLPKGIIGIEKTENMNELIDIYSSADIFLNPTLEDNFPTTNIEALACGTPVITFNTGGSPEAIDDSCGMVVEKSLDALVDACLKFGRKSKTTSQYCIIQAKKFSEKKCFERYLELYEK